MWESSDLLWHVQIFVSVYLDIVLSPWQLELLKPLCDQIIKMNLIIAEVTKVTQNNTDMYTQGSSQQTFEIPNNNLDVKFQKAYQNHNNEILWTRKEEFQNVIIPMHRTRFDQYQVSSAVLQLLHEIKYFES